MQRNLHETVLTKTSTNSNQSDLRVTYNSYIQKRKGQVSLCVTPSFPLPPPSAMKDTHFAEDNASAV